MIRFICTPCAAVLGHKTFDRHTVFKTGICSRCRKENTIGLQLSLPNDPLEYIYNDDFVDLEKVPIGIAITIAFCDTCGKPVLITPTKETHGYLRHKKCNNVIRIRKHRERKRSLNNETPFNTTNPDTDAPDGPSAGIEPSCAEP